MGNKKNQEKQQFKTRRKLKQPEKENTKPTPTPASHPKPCPLHCNPFTTSAGLNGASQGLNDTKVAAIAALTSLGGHHVSVPKNHSQMFDTIVDQALGISPEEAVQLNKVDWSYREQEEEEDEKDVSDTSSEDEEEGPFMIKYQLLKNIGYLPSFIPKSQKPLAKLLEGPESYEAMIEELEEYIDDCKGKKGRKVKPFHVSIVDTGPKDDDGKKEGPTKKSKDTQPAALLEEEDAQEHKIMKQILDKAACTEHPGKVCYVHTDPGNQGKHYNLSNADLTLWTTLAHKQLASIDVVPHSALMLDKKFQAQANVNLSRESMGTNDADVTYDATMDVWDATMDDAAFFNSNNIWYY
ncbi:hypothetical protein E4T56_gene16110 [Termitomyces sp. T112]|nr:hypothetical protein E4T56_gene16110 [Termitomyces sp. T112]